MSVRLQKKTSVTPIPCALTLKDLMFAAVWKAIKEMVWYAQVSKYTYLQY